MNAPTGLLVTAVKLLSFEGDRYLNALCQNLDVVHAANRARVTAAQSWD